MKRRGGNCRVTTMTAGREKGGKKNSRLPLFVFPPLFLFLLRSKNRKRKQIIMAAGDGLLQLDPGEHVYPPEGRAEARKEERKKERPRTSTFSLKRQPPLFNLENEKLPKNSPPPSSQPYLSSVGAPLPLRAPQERHRHAQPPQSGLRPRRLQAQDDRPEKVRRPAVERDCRAGHDQGGARKSLLLLFLTPFFPLFRVAALPLRTREQVVRGRMRARRGWHDLSGAS